MGLVLFKVDKDDTRIKCHYEYNSAELFRVKGKYCIERVIDLCTAPRVFLFITELTNNNQCTRANLERKIYDKYLQYFRIHLSISLRI